MPIRRSIQPRRAATPIEQAAWTVAAVPAAVAIPALLQWVIGSIAQAGRGEAGYPALATRMAVDATGMLVHWMGIGILAGLAVLCAAMAAAYLNAARGRRGEVHPRAVAEAYALGTVAAVAGLLWLA